VSHQVSNNRRRQRRTPADTGDAASQFSQGRVLAVRIAYWLRDEEADVKVSLTVFLFLCSE
jgi:hypothetical protein